MTRLVALAVVISMVTYLWVWFNRNQLSTSKVQKAPRTRKKLKLKPGEMWVQVFETSMKEEARAIQMRLEEEDLSVILFEQAKKNISGDTPAGIGVAVPKEESSYAQQLIFRYLEHLDGGKSKTGSE